MEATEKDVEMVEANPSNPSNVEAAPATVPAPEEHVKPGETTLEKLSIPLPKQDAEENHVESNEELAKNEENAKVNGETEPEEAPVEVDERGKTEPEEVDVNVQDALEPVVKDEVESAINEQELKYWKAVETNPQDFTSWTYLLQFVEHENKLVSARRAFDSFLKRYPFCYGYWKKFADMEKKNGDLVRAREVFERGVDAISLSVDLWVHYLNFTSHSTKAQPDSASVMRSLFERAISAAGEDFRSDKLWDAYIEWEKSQRQLQRVTALYDRVLTIPTQNYMKHWEKFQEHINSISPHEVLTAEELLKLKAEVGAAPPGFSFESEPAVATPPGTENQVPDVPAGEEKAADTTKPEDPEVSAVRAKVIALRKVLRDANEVEVNKRWAFEDAIKRPYFHVKPLERVQLKNWRDYLDFEISTGNHRRVVILFERCVIACALYEDFWQRFASYMEVYDCVEGCQLVYQRACGVHLPSKPHIHLAWAAFEEKHGNVEKAREILANLDVVVPGLAYVKLRRANLERRSKQFPNACAIYESAISASAEKDLSSFYAIKYARFLIKIAKNFNKAREVLKAALEKDKENKRLYLQLLDLELSAAEIDEEKVEEIFDMVKNSSLPEDIKEGFSQRRLEFLEHFSNSIIKISKAQEAHSKLYKSKTSISSGRKRSQEDGLEPSSKVAKSDVTSDAAQSTGVYDSSADYSAAYAASSTSYNYNTSHWPGYPAGHSAYNYANWYQQQYGHAYQQAQ